MINQFDKGIFGVKLKQRKICYYIFWDKYKIKTYSEEEMKHAIIRLKKEGITKIKIIRK